MLKTNFIKNTLPKANKPALLELFDEKSAESALKFHKSFPQYQKTPLASLPNLAEYLGVGCIYVKDESYRFDLNAFKVLGASYAMGKYLAKKLQLDISELSYEMLTSPETRKRLGDITFYAATDGNHGRAVAWTARNLGQKAVIYMPKGSSQKRLQNILNEGADASITELNYDDAVRLANSQAEKTGGVIIQDTAWDGYEEIPTWIMQGYGTMAAEAYSQLDKKPTHLFLQAGVGSMAAGVLGYFAKRYGANCPITTIGESDVADCYYKSAIKGNGEAVCVGGDMLTIMAGLACGEPNIISFDLIKDYAFAFASCNDQVSATGMRMLGNPPKGDDRVISGESGALGMGLLAHILQCEDMQKAKEQLGLDKNSVILLFSTEGDTDEECYKNIIYHCKNEY